VNNNPLAITVSALLTISGYTFQYFDGLDLLNCRGRQYTHTVTTVDSGIVTFNKEERCHGEESRRPVFSAVTNETKSSAVAEKVRDAPRYLEMLLCVKHRSCAVVNELSVWNSLLLSVSILTYHSHITKIVNEFVFS